MTIGAAYGQLVAQLVRHIARELGSNIGIANPTYAVVGAAAMLAGFTRYKCAHSEGSSSILDVMAVHRLTKELFRP